MDFSTFPANIFQIFFAFAHIFAQNMEKSPNNRCKMNNKKLKKYGLFLAFPYIFCGQVLQVICKKLLQTWYNSLIFNELQFL